MESKDRESLNEGLKWVALIALVGGSLAAGSYWYQASNPPGIRYDAPSSDPDRRGAATEHDLSRGRIREVPPGQETFSWLWLSFAVLGGVAVLISCVGWLFKTGRESAGYKAAPEGATPAATQDACPEHVAWGAWNENCASCSYLRRKRLGAEKPRTSQPSDASQ